MLLLYANIASFLTYTDINSGVRFESVKPSIIHATTKYIIPAIGEHYYTYLTELDNPTDKESTLLDMLRRALGSFTLYEYSFITEVQLSDKGMRRGHDDSLPGAFKYQVQEYRKTVIERAFMQLDEALAFLESMAKDNEADEWVDSDFFKEYTDLFIKNGNDFKRVLNQCQFPRRFYVLLRSWIKNVQVLSIRKLITPELYDALMEKNQEADPDFSVEEKELLFRLNSCIAHFAVARGAAAIISAMDENGIHVLANSSESTNAAGKRSAAPNSVLNHVIESYNKTAQDWLDAAIEYLDEKATASVFPEWFAYKQTLSEQVVDPCKTFNGVFSM